MHDSSIERARGRGRGRGCSRLGRRRSWRGTTHSRRRRALLLGLLLVLLLVERHGNGELKVVIFLHLELGVLGTGGGGRLLGLLC